MAYVSNGAVDAQLTAIPDRFLEQLSGRFEENTWTKLKPLPVSTHPDTLQFIFNLRIVETGQLTHKTG